MLSTCTPARLNQQQSQQCRDLEMPTYKLTYFNGRGRAEPSRYVFAQAGVQYEDVRLPLGGEEFGKLKPSLPPPGSLPVLEVDGKIITGSGTITRFLAEEFNLAGANAIENAQLDGLVDICNDLYSGVAAVFFGADAGKAAAKEKLLNESIPKYLGSLEKRIEANNSADGYIYGNKLTYVDMRISILLDDLSQLEPSIFDSYPGLNKLSKTVKAQPKIAEWIKKRPDTPF